MKLFIAKDDAAFKKQAATIFVTAAHEAIKDHGIFCVALSGGSTPKKLFASLTDPYFRSRVDWPAVHFFWSDERCVPPDHADSNFRMTQEHLLSKLTIGESHIHRIPTEMGNPRDVAKTYQATIKAHFKVDLSVPRFDLICLGMGEDGHTASLFPGTEALKEGIKWVVANHVSKLSADRITFTYPLINNARTVFLMAEGPAKAKVIKEIFDENTPINRYPIQRVNPSGQYTWLLDTRAGSELPGSIREEATYL